MKTIVLFTFIFLSTIAFSQTRTYTTANAHSHNDYEKSNPFYEAYENGFGSIEADIFLLKGSDHLFVAHTQDDLNKKRRTLDSLYLAPLTKMIKRNKGYIYPDRTRQLQFLVDIKTEAEPTLRRLIAVLQNYPELINTPSVKIVISGNRPSPDSFSVYPLYIYFDGVIGTQYSLEALSRIPLFSGNFTQFSRWIGSGTLPPAEKTQLSNLVAQLHKDAKPVRFWGAPDTVDAWKELMSVGADYINTDLIKTLTEFLKTPR